ncbi:phospholipase D-like domain-containing protein [Candidatus Chlorohelix sp.]|uniref:phospholipase D-like domain-containing protein n=1 Tax=Candidatus Chlorohelix sp. TaxID=3139201 RepID=UPI00305B103B
MAGNQGNKNDPENYVPQRERTIKTLLVSGIALIVVAAIAIVALLALGGSQTPTAVVTAEATENPQQEVSSVLDTTPKAIESAVVEGALGSGGYYKTDWYWLYFTAPVYPDNPNNHKGGLDQYLTNFISTAQSTVDIADYDFDLANVADAMVAAAKRGVRVRMVTDTDTLTNKDKNIQAAFDKLKKANIPIVDDQRGAIMHNKFTVVDNKVVSTGSWNYTDGDTYHLNNNVIFITNQQLAQNYTTEFEKMFTKKQFGPNKDKGVPYPSLLLGNTKIENYFSAEDGVAQKIVDKIGAAKSSIYFMAFSFTHNGIGKAIMDKAKAGVKVGGVFETTGSQTVYSQYKKMLEQKLDVYTDGNPWVMHHKVIIIDEHITIFGSFNFSDNADKSNDENLLIIDDEGLAKAFKTEYDRVLEVAKAKKK